MEDNGNMTTEATANTSIPNEDDDGVEEPTQGMIDKWKQSGKLFRINLCGVNYYYRPITRAEYRNIQKRVNAAQRQMMSNNESDAINMAEEQTAMVAVLWPKLTRENMGALPAGVIPKLMEMITEASGFDDMAMPEEL